MLIEILDDQIEDQVKNVYQNAGEKGIDISRSLDNFLCFDDDDFEPFDTKFGVVIDDKKLQNIKYSQVGQIEVSKNMMIGCLNYGFVELQDWLGSDEEIIAAARTSYASGQKSSGDKVLLRYLMRHLHTTPFEAATAIKLRMYVPIVVYRQLFRHRTASQLEPQFISNDTAFSTYSVQNEMSGRYVELPDHFYIPETRRIQLQSKTNKQGSEVGGIELDKQLAMRRVMEKSLDAAREAYHTLLENGVARETARNVLPLTQYTLLVWKIDLKNLLHFLMLRLDPHAQWEVRQYAKAIAQFVKRLFPLTWSAFEDYQLNVTRFSSIEMSSLAECMSINNLEDAIKSFNSKVSNEREREEFSKKIHRYFNS